MGILLSALYFYFLVWIFGRDSDPALRWKAVGIVLAGGIVQAVCLLKFHIGPLVTLILATGVMVTLLVVWCRIAFVTAVKIVGLFLLGSIVATFLIASLSAQAST